MTDEEKKAISEFLSYLYEPTLQLMADALQNLTAQMQDASANGCNDEAAKIRIYQSLVDTELKKAMS